MGILSLTIAVLAQGHHAGTLALRVVDGTGVVQEAIRWLLGDAENGLRGQNVALPGLVPDIRDVPASFPHGAGQGDIADPLHGVDCNLWL